MKHCKQYIIILSILLPLLGRSEQPVPMRNIEIQQTRRSNRHDVELSVSANLASVGDISKVKSIPVKFTVKNICTETIGILHVGSYYRDSVEICLADKLDEPNKLFPISAIGGSSQKIAPGESVVFYVDVPIELFKMEGKKFIAGICYGTATFEGEAFSKPFSFPPLK
jgi:hypothetical protein